jgi:hypothetical protein
MMINFGRVRIKPTFFPNKFIISKAEEIHALSHPKLQDGSTIIAPPPTLSFLLEMWKVETYHHLLFAPCG